MLVSSARVYLASFLSVSYFSFSYFFFNDTATTEIYTLSLHDALPISRARHRGVRARPLSPRAATDSDVAPHERGALGDRKSTRLNSSHTVISYAVFCLKKKKKKQKPPNQNKTNKYIASAIPISHIQRT